MTIIGSYYLFIHKNVKECKPKIHDEIVGLGFDLGHLKMNTYCIRKSSFCKGLSKGLIWFLEIHEKKNQNDKNLLVTFKSTYILKTMKF